MKKIWLVWFLKESIKETKESIKETHLHAPEPSLSSRRQCESRATESPPSALTPAAALCCTVEHDLRLVETGSQLRAYRVEGIQS